MVSVPVAAEPLVAGRLARTECRAALGAVDCGGPSSMKDKHGKHDKNLHAETGEPPLQASAVHCGVRAQWRRFACVRSPVAIAQPLRQAFRNCRLRTALVAAWPAVAGTNAR